MPNGLHLTGTYSFGIIYTNFSFDTGSMWDGEFVQVGNLMLDINKEIITFSAKLILPEGDSAIIEYKGNYLFLEPENEN